MTYLKLLKHSSKQLIDQTYHCENLKYKNGKGKDFISKRKSCIFKAIVGESMFQKPNKQEEKSLQRLIKEKRNISFSNYRDIFKRDRKL